MNFDEPQAIYLQISDYMAEKIMTGTWPQGERVPSVRETAKELKVNVNTVMRSYGFLQDKNIIANQRGIGYFVTDSAIELVTAWKRSEFNDNILPRLFHQAEILEYSPEELKQEYRKYLEKKT